jgi:hypothetical protein
MKGRTPTWSRSSPDRRCGALSGGLRPDDCHVAYVDRVAYLVTWDVDDRQVLCAGTGLSPMRLQIDMGQSPPAWVVDVETGDRLEVIWPHGFQLRLAAQPELIDGQGKVVARAGDIIRNWVAVCRGTRSRCARSIVIRPTTTIGYAAGSRSRRYSGIGSCDGPHSADGPAAWVCTGFNDSVSWGTSPGLMRGAVRGCAPARASRATLAGRRAAPADSTRLADGLIPQTLHGVHGRPLRGA